MKVPQSETFTEVMEMNRLIDNWIEYEELPVKSALKVIRTNDPNWGLSDDEIQERNEFISWYLQKDFAILRLMVFASIRAISSESISAVKPYSANVFPASLSSAIITPEIQLYVCLGSAPFDMA